MTTLVLIMVSRTTFTRDLKKKWEEFLTTLRTAGYAEDATIAELLGPTTKRQGWPGATLVALGVSVLSCQYFANRVQNKNLQY
jgi:hypothetical protein